MHAGKLSSRLLVQPYDRYDSLGLALVISELRVKRRLSLIQPVVLLAQNLSCNNSYCLVADLYLDVRMRLDVVLPVGVSRGASLRREDDVALPITKVHDRDHVVPARPSS